MTTNTGEDIGTEESCVLLLGVKTGATTMGTSEKLSQKREARN